MILFVAPQALTAHADTEAELDAAEARLKNLIGTIQSEEAEAAALQTDLNRLAGEIEAAESVIENTRADIAATREEIAETQARFDSLQARLTARAEELFMAPDMGFDLILSSDSMTDLSDRMIYLDVVAQQDADLSSATQNQANVLAATKQSLGDALEAQREDLTQLNAARTAVASKFAEQQAQIDQISAMRSEAEDLIARLERKLKAEQVPVIPPPTSGGTGDGIPGPLYACPVNGPHAYADTFGILHEHEGWSHIHEGNDIVSPYGTPIVAPFDGVAVSGNSSTGGIYVTVNGSQGSVIMMHMSRLGGLGSVQTGDVVGYIGDTGNASGPHTHFEWHPGGGAAADPYPQLNEVC